MSLENYSHATLRSDLEEVARLIQQLDANTQEASLAYCDQKYRSPDSDLIANALAEILVFQAKNRDSLIESGMMTPNGRGGLTVNPEMTRALHFYFFHVHAGEITDAPEMAVLMGHVNILRSRPQQ